MKMRSIGSARVAEIGLGCMCLSHAYGLPPSPRDAQKVLRRAVDLGITHFDTAALYGFGANESLLGEALAGVRDRVHLATKCGMTGVDGKRVIDGRPETLKRTCHESLTRLRTDVIDLWYLHRWDKRVPIEDSVGALADLVRAGKVRAIGLSEVSAPTIRRAHRVHPIAAVQTEYSLWTRNPEVAVLDVCADLDITLVAFSPLARGFLTGALRDVTTLPPKDIRLAMPRFQGDHFARNLTLLDGLSDIARESGASMGQVALAWLLAQSPRIVPIPGTTQPAHLAENVAAVDVRLTAAAMRRLDSLINAGTVSGARYNESVQAEIDTEEIVAGHLPSRPVIGA